MFSRFCSTQTGHLNIYYGTLLDWRDILHTVYTYQSPICWFPTLTVAVLQPFVICHAKSHPEAWKMKDAIPRESGQCRGEKNPLEGLQFKDNPSGLGSTYPTNHQELSDHFDVISVTVLFFLASVNNGILAQRKVSCEWLSSYSVVSISLCLESMTKGSRISRLPSSPCPFISPTQDSGWGHQLQNHVLLLSLCSSSIPCEFTNWGEGA